MNTQLLGEQIRAARKSQGLSLKSLGMKAGVHYTQISRMERGASILISKNMQKICEILKVPLPGCKALAQPVELAQRVQSLLQAWPHSEPLISAVVDALETALADQKKHP